MAIPGTSEAAGISQGGVHGAAEVIRTKYQFVAETHGVDAALLAIRRFTQANDRLDASSSLDQIATARRKGIAALEQTLNGAAGSLTNLHQTARTMQPTAEKLGLTMGEYQVMIDKAARRVRPFNFALLGVMFAGMQLSRILGGLFRDMLTGFRNAQEQNSAFNTRMSQLGAQVQHLKFQFVDAFIRTPLFQSLIEGASRLLDWFSSLSDSTKAWLMGVLAVAAILATMVFIGGSILAWSQSVKAVWITMVAASAANNGYLAVGVGKMIAFWAWLKASALALGVIALGIGATIVLFTRVNQKAKDFEGNWAAAIAYFGTEVAIVIEKASQFFDDFITTIALGFLSWWRIAFESWGEQFGNMINWAIRQVNRLISRVNKIPGINIGLLSEIGPRSFHSNLDSVINRIINDSASRRSGRLDSIAEFERRLDSVDRLYGVGEEFHSAVDEFEEALAGIDALRPSDEKSVDVSFGDIIINGNMDPVAFYDEFKVKLERELEENNLQFGVTS